MFWDSTTPETLLTMWNLHSPISQLVSVAPYWTCQYSYQPSQQGMERCGWFQESFSAHEPSIHSDFQEQYVCWHSYQAIGVHVACLLLSNEEAGSDWLMHHCCHLAELALAWQKRSRQNQLQHIPWLLFSAWCALLSCSPTFFVVFGRVTTVSTASAWHLGWRYFLKLTIASFWLEKSFVIWTH